jgi:hypothetical protein
MHDLWVARASRFDYFFSTLANYEWAIQALVTVQNKVLAPAWILKAYADFWPKR